jgi:hypothetical protein
MDFQYEKEICVDNANNHCTRFYHYVDLIIELLERERSNPYTGELYCPYDDPRFEMLPVKYSGEAYTYQFLAYFTIPLGNIINQVPTTRVESCLEVHMILYLDERSRIRHVSFLINLWTQHPYFHYMNRMILDSLNNDDEKKDGLRIFIASVHHYYSGSLDNYHRPMDSDLQFLRRRKRIEKNYRERHERYIHYIRYELPLLNHQLELFMGPLGPGGQHHPSQVDGIRDHYVREHNNFMREVTSQGVPPES